MIEPWESVLRLVIAALLGSIIGWEREYRNKQAGIKTHMLVSLGSALIMLISIYGFRELIEHPNARFDPARLAAQVVSGIGFIGAGAILLKSNRIVQGITTAATLWVVAAIGLSVGAGFYMPAITTVSIVLFMMFVIRRVESAIVPGSRVSGLTLLLEDRPGMLGKITSFLGEENVDIRKLQIVDDDREDDFEVEVFLQVRAGSKQQLLEVVDRLNQLDGVKEVQFDE
ncbi:MAG: MgtC/SapB family protein [Bacillaceae bacterium]|nr:MgtC/SapB family protein [Bacillaceae bacterium]